MKLSDYFDKIFVIGALGSEKIRHTIDSLKKLKLHDENVLVHLYTDANFLRNLTHIECYTPYVLSLALAHYTVIKQAYNANLNSVLIMEDDCCFFDDLSEWELCLKNLPNDWDIFRFGACCSNESDKLQFNNCLFIENHLISFGCACAYALNRKAMSVYIENFEKFWQPADQIHDIFIHECDDYYNNYKKSGQNINLNTYFYKTTLMIAKYDIEVKYRGCILNYTDYDSNRYI